MGGTENGITKEDFVLVFLLVLDVLVDLRCDWIEKLNIEQGTQNEEF